MDGKDVVSNRPQDLQPRLRRGRLWLVRIARWLVTMFRRRRTRLEKIRNDDDQPQLTRTRRKRLARRTQIGRSRRFELFERLEHTKNPALASTGRRLTTQIAPERDDRQPIEMRQTHV